MELSMGSFQMAKNRVKYTLSLSPEKNHLFSVLQGNFGALLTGQEMKWGGDGERSRKVILG